MRLHPAALLLPLTLAACVPGNIPTGKSAAAPDTKVLPEGVWMKGDLHLHSSHSTDAADNPLAGLVALAEDVGMDYFMTTDHDNHVNGDIAGNTWADPAYHSDKMVMLYGAEWTTHRGHGNTFSAAPYDHQRLYDVRDDLDVVIGQTVKDLGVHLSANHPSGDDNWGFSYDMVKSIEVWSSSINPSNRGYLEIWDDMLKSGRKLTGRGGSDAHHSYTTSPADWTSNVWQGLVNNVGTPTTWVYARERSAQAVVDALDDGRVSVSASPFSERVEFQADSNGDGVMEHMMGEIADASGKPVNFRVDMVGGTGIPVLYSISVIRDGEVLRTIQTLARSVDFSDTPPADFRSYYRVEVRGIPTSVYPEVPGAPLVSGRMLAISNPIYFDIPDAACWE